jgi:hypothetical protein
VRRAVASLTALLLLPAAAGRAETPVLVVDPAQSDVEMTLEVIAFGSDSDTEPVPVSGSATADVTTESHPSFGRVANGLRFVESEVTLGNAVFDLVLPAFALSVQTLSLAGEFTGEAVVATPVGPGASSADLAPIDLLIDSGTIEMTITPPGTVVSMDLAEAPFVFALGEAGTIESTAAPGSTDFTLTIPVTETASTTQDGITVNVTLAGSIVLVGSAAVPSASKPGLALLALLLALAGAHAAARGSAPARLRIVRDSP